MSHWYVEVFTCKRTRARADQQRCFIRFASVKSIAWSRRRMQSNRAQNRASDSCKMQARNVYWFSKSKRSIKISSKVGKRASEDTDETKASEILILNDSRRDVPPEISYSWPAYDLFISRRKSTIPVDYASLWSQWLETIKDGWCWLKYIEDRIVAFNESTVETCYDTRLTGRRIYLNGYLSRGMRILYACDDERKRF